MWAWSNGYNVINAKKRTSKNPIYIIGNSFYSNSIIGGAGNDTLDGGDSLPAVYSYTDEVLTGGKGKDLFVYRGGNDIITDYTAGQDKIQITRSDYSTYHVSDKDVILHFGNSSGSSNALRIAGGVGKKISLDLNGKSTVATFKDYEITVPSAKVSVVNGNDSNLSKMVTFDASKRKKNAPVTITGSAEHSNLIKGGAGDDILDAGSSLDSIKNTLTGGKGKDVFIYRGSNDVITDYTPGQDTISVVGSLRFEGYGLSNYMKGLEFTFKDTSTGNSKILTIEGGVGKKIDFASDGKATIPASGTYGSIKYTFNRNDTTELLDIASINANGYTDQYSYLEVIDASKKNKPITIIDSNANGEFKFDGVIVGSSKADSLSAGSSMFGGAGNDTLSAINSWGTLNGGAGNDKLIAESGTATLIGGAGKDTFSITSTSNTSGNFTINDYTAGQDVIQLGSGIGLASVNYFEDSYTDLVFELSGTEKTLTVQNAIKFNKGVSTPKKITFVNADGTKTSQVYAQTSLNIANSDGQTIDLSAAVNSSVINANASSRSAKNQIYLIGNSNNNSLVGGKGADTIVSNGGNNTITGGKGDDTIELGSGNNTIKYTTGDGNDVITNYKAGDIIELGSAKTQVSKATLSGSDYMLTIGKNKLTLKDIGSDTSVTVVDYNGATKTYNDTAKTAAFMEKNLVEDTWFTSLESSATAVEVDELVNEFAQNDAISYNEDSLISKYKVIELPTA